MISFDKKLGHNRCLDRLKSCSRQRRASKSGLDFWTPITASCVTDLRQRRVRKVWLVAVGAGNQLWSGGGKRGQIENITRAVLRPSVNVVFNQLSGRHLIQRRGVTFRQRRYNQFTVASQSAPERVGLDPLWQFELLGVLALAQLLGGSFLVPALDLDSVLLDDEHGDFLGGEGQSDVDRQRHLAASVVIEEHRHAVSLACRTRSRRRAVAGGRDHGRPGRRCHVGRRGRPQRSGRPAVAGPLRARVGVVSLAEVQRLGRQRSLDDQYTIGRQERLESSIVHLLRFLDLPLVFALGSNSMIVLFESRASDNDPFAVRYHPKAFGVKSGHVEAQFIASPCTSVAFQLRYLVSVSVTDYRYSCQIGLSRVINSLLTYLLTYLPPADKNYRAKENS